MSEPAHGEVVDDGLMAAPPKGWSRRGGWVRRIAGLVLSLLIAWAIVRLVGRVDWGAVKDSLSELAWWQLVVLVGMLFVRQYLNALPLAFCIPGLGHYRAIVNDLASHLLSVAVPPPGDMVLRVGMFTSWGIDASRAIAGSVLNTLAFYTVRFSVPVLGFFLILGVRFDAGYGVSALIGAGVASTILVLIALGLRSEELARWLGRAVGARVARVRKSVDPDAWGESVVGFRVDMRSTFSKGFSKSAVALVCLVVTDATMVLLSLRFVGVDANSVPAIEVYAGFLCVYPLTIFPLMGLGIVDAVLLATFVDAGGHEVEGAGIAALVVWRSFTLAGPVLLGAVSLAMWKRSIRSQTDPEPAAP
jgi:putative heme transporter